MAAQPVLIPGPDHPITITANPKRVRVSAGGVVVADSTHALTLKDLRGHIIALHLIAETADRAQLAVGDALVGGFGLVGGRGGSRAAVRLGRARGS